MGGKTTWKCGNLTCTASRNKTPLTGIADIAGAVEVGQVLTAGATVTYQWKQSDTLNGVFSDIS